MDARSAVSRIDYYTQGVLEAAKNSDSGREITWVIVESDDDCEVYGDFLLSDGKVKLRDSGCKERNQRGEYLIRRGWKRVERLVSDFSNSLTIVGIRDKDYTSFVSGYQHVPNIFETDCRDLEMMMIQSGVLNRFIPSWVLGRDLNNILESVFRHTRILGYMRIMNDVLDLTCKFHDFLKRSLLWDQTVHDYLTDWKSRLIEGFISHCASFVTEEQFEAFVAGRNLDVIAVYNVCRGHDVVDHLSWNLVKNQFSSKNLIAAMKEHYSYPDFQQTELYRDLRSWEKRSGKRLLKD